MTWSIRNEFIPNYDRGVNCSVCNSDLRVAMNGTRERVVSTGTFIHMEGVFAICETCIAEAASMIGWIAPERADALGKKNRLLGQENANLRKATAALEEIRKIL